MLKSVKRHLLLKAKIKKLEAMKMAKYGEKKDFTFTDKEGTETKFTFQHVGLQGSYEMLERTKEENGNTSITALHKELFEHVIRSAEGEKVSYAWFEEKKYGSSMLKDVVKAATSFIFRED